MTWRQKTFTWLSIAVRGARLQFGIAMALVSVIPALSLLHLSNYEWHGAGHTETWGVILFGVVASILLGYILLSKYPATIIKLRAYVQDMVKGEMPNRISLLGSEDDITAIESGMNLILDRLRSKLRTSEAQAIKLQEQLFHAQKLESIGTLASGVAHEINNPIMGIMNYAQLITDRLGPDHPVSEFATEIGKESQRVATIVKNLLHFARQETETHRSTARMCDIVEDTLSLIRTVMRHDQIALEVDIPEDLPTILCHSQQIKQVIMNLLTNARDALNQKYPRQDGNKKASVTARLIEKDGRQWCRTTVEDHGPGIPDDLRKRIFDPFFTTKPRDKGTGLGLSISHGIVEEHGGQLSFESEAGHWTRFHIDLPIEDV